MMKSHGSGISVNINAHDGHGHSCPSGHDVLRVLDIATRDAIPPHHRHEGMWVLVLEEMTFYRLTGGLTNDCWVMCGGGHDHDGGDGDISPDDLPIASKTQKGIVQIGDNINVNADGLIAVPAASDDTAGVVELASAEEAKTGTDSSKAVTPAGLAEALVQDKVDNPLPIASKIQKGIVQIGDNISVDVDGLIAVPAASDDTAGVVELASAEETKAGIDSSKAVTPAGLAEALVQDKVDHPLPGIATTDKIGLVKGGENISIAEDGTVYIPSQTANVVYYIAKTGDDSNDGLAENRAFATWSRAYDVACTLSCSRGTGVFFKFGPGQWERVSIYAGSLRCAYVNITAIDTVEANWPSFTRIDCTGTVSTLSYIDCDAVYASSAATVTISTAATLGVVCAQLNSYLRLAGGAYTVKKVGSSAYFVYSGYMSSIRISDVGTTITFREDCAYASGLLYAAYGSYILLYGSRVVLSGAAQTGRKAYVYGMSTIEIAGAAKNSIPGVGAYVGSGGVFCNDGLTMPLGFITLSPFRAADLPFGWHICNGGGFSTTSLQGAALAALPASFKTDWKITTSGSTIYKPNLLIGGTVSGQGPFFRPSNSVPGTIVGDAIRNITGDSGELEIQGTDVKGAFTTKADPTAARSSTWVNSKVLAFDASRVVPTAAENRPLSVAMTPAIWLGC